MKRFIQTLFQFRRRLLIVAVLFACWGRFATTPVSAAEEFVFIQRTATNPAKDAASHLYEVVRMTVDGKDRKRTVLHQAKLQTLHAVTACADGTILVLQTTQPLDGKPKPQILQLQADGTVSKTIDLGKLPGMPFGSPSLLPDGKHIGITLCKKGVGVPRNKVPQIYRPPVPTGGGAFNERVDQVSRLRPWIVVIDLQGKLVRDIGPGALPRWSPDGKQILFSDVTVSNIGSDSNPAMEWGPSRISLMDDEGKKRRAIGPNATFDASFSPDGKHVAYLIGVEAGINRRTSIQLSELDSDGALKSDKRMEERVQRVRKGNEQRAGDSGVSPRWSASGNAIVSNGSWAATLGDRMSLVFLNSNGGIDISSDLRGVAKMGFDFDAECLTPSATFVLSAQQQEDQAKPNNDKTNDSNNSKKDPTLKAVPPGQKIVTRGTKVFFQDKAGKLTPAPDGEYLWNGFRIYVVAGEKS